MKQIKQDKQVIIHLYCNWFQSFFIHNFMTQNDLLEEKKTCLFENNALKPKKCQPIANSFFFIFLLFFLTTQL